MSGKNIDTRRNNIRRGKSGGRITKVHKRRLLNHLKAEYFGAVIFVLIFIYMIFNFLFYSNKEKAGIYEVQADEISTDNVYKGIALRTENIITSDYAGYINYYIQNGKRSAKNGVIFSVDEGSKIYGQIVENTGLDQLQENDIKSIKNVIYGFLDDYNGFNFEQVVDFKTQLSDTIYELVNDSSIENMKSITAGNTSSAFHVRRTDSAGVISYRNDKLCGKTFEDITDDMFKDGYEVGQTNLRSTGLILAGDPICRIVTDEKWQIAVNIPEKTYIDLLEQNSIQVYINDYYIPVECGLKTEQRGSSYYALLSLDKYMPMYIDERFLDIEFVSDTADGLKIPVSSISKKEFYVIPLSYLTENEQFTGEVFLKVGLSEETGSPIYIPVYPSKYYSDSDYAYVDLALFEEGDVIGNKVTGENYVIGLKKGIEGVYVVNKGYYQFVKIEKIKQNAEYAIVKKNMKDGLNLYDHIALDAASAKDKAIIY